MATVLPTRAFLACGLAFLELDVEVTACVQSGAFTSSGLTVTHKDLDGIRQHLPKALEVGTNFTDVRVGPPLTRGIPGSTNLDTVFVPFNAVRGGQRIFSSVSVAHSDGGSFKSQLSKAFVPSGLSKYVNWRSPSAKVMHYFQSGPEFQTQRDFEKWCEVMTTVASLIDGLVDSGFRPDIDGFPFPNYPYTAPVVKEIQWGGHCFGMCQAAIDYFTFARAQPFAPNKSGKYAFDPMRAPFWRSCQPGNGQLMSGSKLDQWISSRHNEQALGFTPVILANALKYRTGLDVPGGLGKAIMKHGYGLLRSRFGEGRPQPIGMLGRDQVQKVGHALVVYRIREDNSTSRATLWVYDPNEPLNSAKTASVNMKDWSFDYGGAYDFFWPVENFRAQRPAQ